MRLPSSTEMRQTAPQEWVRERILFLGIQTQTSLWPRGSLPKALINNAYKFFPVKALTGGCGISETRCLGVQDLGETDMGTLYNSPKNSQPPLGLPATHHLPTRSAAHEDPT